MVDNYFKVKGGITFDGYSGPPTDEGSLSYSGQDSRLEFRDGYGNLKEIAYTDDIAIFQEAKLEVPRIVLNVTDPVSQTDNAGLVIKYGESMGDELFGQVLFTGEYNPVVLWDKDTNSWFIGTGEGVGAMIGSDGYGTTLSANIGTAVTIEGDFRLPDLNPGAGYVLTSDEFGFANWEIPSTGVWTLESSNYNAEIGDRILADSSGGPFTIFLPPSPQEGDVVLVVDMTSSFAANNVTLDRNGSNIMGSASNLVLNIDKAWTELVYADATNGWRVRP